jgi:hypothetical protein
MSYESNKLAKLTGKPRKEKLNEIPEELLAEGSGKIG